MLGEKLKKVKAPATHKNASKIIMIRLFNAEFLIVAAILNGGYL
jgi:hypothetical protein